MKINVTTAKGDLRQLKQQWQNLNDDLTVNWSGLDNAAKIAVLRATAIFTMRVLKYILSKETDDSESRV